MGNTAIYRVIIALGLGLLAAGGPAVGLAGCHGKPSTVPSTRLGLRLTNAKVANQYSRHSAHVNLPFQLVDRGVNGTGLMIAFMQRLEQYGAMYVSDVALSLQMSHNGKDIECVTKIAIDDGTPAPASTPELGPDDNDGEPEYTTTVVPWRPRIVTAWVVDRELACAQHAQQVALPEPKGHRDTTYNAEVGQLAPVGMYYPDTTTIVFYDRCTYEPNRRYVQRYEHFVAAKISPPELRVVERSYADFPLVAEPPLCHEIKRAPGQPYRQAITGEVYYPTWVVRDQENVYKMLQPVTVQWDPAGG